MGVEVVDEHPYEFPGPKPFWIYDFGLRREPAAKSGPGGRTTQVPQVSLASVAGQLEGALAALWKGEIEDDDFNTLVLNAGLSWRQVVVLRAYAKYLQQAGTTFSSGYIARVLRSNPVIARQLVRLFESRFDPDRVPGQAERSEALFEEIGGALDEVASLDEDRILRAYLGLIIATERTNYFRSSGESDGSAPYLVFKLDAALVPDLPAPRPKFALFVYCPIQASTCVSRTSLGRPSLVGPARLPHRDSGAGQGPEVIVPSGAKGVSSASSCQTLPIARPTRVLACYRVSSVPCST
jgi:glutamate dehydrogenase